MKSGWRVGSLFGIPLFLDPSWFFILLLVTVLYGSAWQGQNWGPGTGWIAGFIMALLLFGSVLLHELGHSLVALSQGINVTSITLFLFGGVASIDQESKTPGQAFQVAIAGPAVSLGLFVLLSLGQLILPMGSPLHAIVERLAWINLVLAIFNMIPGLPLDGGQVLKAAIWKATGNRIQGVRWSARSGQLLGWLAIATGIFLYFTAGNFVYLWLALLGWFGVRNAAAYNRIADLQDVLLRLKAADAMTREFRVVDANSTLREFADQYVLDESRPSLYFAASQGRYRGLISLEDLRQTERSQWDSLTLADQAHPLTDIPSIRETTVLADAILILEDEKLPRITVLTPADAVAGVLDRGDIVRAIAQKLGIPYAGALVRRIKEEGVYPPELQLPAIARSVSTETREPSDRQKNSES